MPWLIDLNSKLLLQRVLLILLALWLCQSAAQFLWLLVPNPSLPEAEIIPARNAQLVAPVASDDVDINALLELDLFGEVVGIPVVQEVPQASEFEDAVDTSLQLQLMGVLSSDDPQHARAIIADNQQQALYSNGESLPVSGNVTLEKVLADRVILNNGGRYESLWLYDPDGEAKPRPVQRRTNATRPTKARTQATVASLPASARSSAITDVIKMSMAREGGDVIGYKVRPGRDRDTFESLGLQVNDIITQVNGVDLDSSAKAMEVYRSMRGATSAEVTLLRNGQPINLRIALD